MSFLRAKPIGMMQMIDQGERDDKIIAVHADDPEYRHFEDISELPKHRLNEIRRFFEDYKKNENKDVKVNRGEDEKGRRKNRKRRKREGDGQKEKKKLTFPLKKQKT